MKKLLMIASGVAVVAAVAYIAYEVLTDKNKSDYNDCDGECKCSDCGGDCKCNDCNVDCDDCADCDELTSKDFADLEN